MNLKLWMIVWVNLISHEMGHGVCVDDKEYADATAAHADVYYAGQYKHWVEPCGEDL